MSCNKLISTKLYLISCYIQKTDINNLISINERKSLLFNCVRGLFRSIASQCSVLLCPAKLTSLACACYLAMAATGASLFHASLSPVVRRDLTSSVGRFNKLNPVSSRRFAVSTSTEQTPVTSTTTSLSEKREELAESVAGSFEVGEVEYRSLMKDYVERSKELIRSDGGPPWWFTPLECGPPLNNSPLLLFLPGQYYLTISLSYLFSSNSEIYISSLQP